MCCVCPQHMLKAWAYKNVADSFIGGEVEQTVNRLGGEEEGGEGGGGGAGC